MRNKFFSDYKPKPPKARICTITLLAVTYLFAMPCHSGDKRIVGWIEIAKIYPEHFAIRAKLDTGAEHSSIDAENINLFRREGDRWVRFDVTNYLGQKSTFERRVPRIVRIKQHNAESQSRFVVKLGLCLGQLLKDVDFNIVDRSNFAFPLLIGRSFMEGDLVVDPSIKLSVEPKCQRATQP